MPQTSAARRPLTHRGALERFALIQELYKSHDPRLVRTVFTEDVVYDDDGWPEPAQGHAGMERLVGAIWRAFPDFSVEVIAGPYLSEEGAGFALHGRVRGTMSGRLDPPGLAPTGTKMSSEFAGFYELERERFRRARIILDTYDLAAQLGAAPKPGSTGQRLALWAQRLQAPRQRRHLS